MKTHQNTMRHCGLKSLAVRWVWVWMVLWPLLWGAGCAGTLRSHEPSRPADVPQAPKAAVPGMEAAQTTVSSGAGEGVENDPFLDENLDFLEEEEAMVSATVADPLEPVNRVMFQFNDKLYFYFLKPVASVYRDVLPMPVRRGIKNFFNNVATPVRFTNCLLQLKGRSAVAEAGRFVVNTTAGGLGFWDLSPRYPGLAPPEEDLGQTLGHHHIGDGFYLVLPVLGPSTLRDFIGFGGDLFLSPITYLESQSLSYGLTGTRIINDTSFRIGDYEAVKEAAVTPYEAFRDGYIQYRLKKIAE